MPHVATTRSALEGMTINGILLTNLIATYNSAKR
jgi:hypothetical protein